MEKYIHLFKFDGMQVSINNKTKKMVECPVKYPTVKDEILSAIVISIGFVLMFISEKVYSYFYIGKALVIFLYIVSFLIGLGVNHIVHQKRNERLEKNGDEVQFSYAEWRDFLPEINQAIGGIESVVIVFGLITLFFMHMAFKEHNLIVSVWCGLMIIFYQYGLIDISKYRYLRKMKKQIENL